MTTPNWPAIDVIVPVYNEAQTIGAKLKNLAALDYPRDRLRVVVVDGRSDDGTAELAEGLSRDAGLPIDLVRSDAIGKPAQIAAGLARTGTAWVLVTDADAHMPRSALKSMVGLARAEERVGLVGAPIRPGGDGCLDHAHWTVVNALRRLERRFGSAGLVVGPCYLARRELLATLGRDTVADDVYISCRALLAGHRIELVADAVLETRAPVGHAELARHKLRKAMAYVRETARAMAHARLRHPATEAVFLWRAALLAGLPAAVIGALACLAVEFGWVGCAAAVVTLLATLRAVASGRGRSPVTRVAALALTPVLTALVLAVAFVMLPFVELTPRYPKVSLPRVAVPDVDVT